MTDPEQAWNERFARAHGFLSRAKRYGFNHYNRAVKYVQKVWKARPDSKVSEQEIKRAQG